MMRSAGFLVLAILSSWGYAEDARLEESRALVDAFQKSLGGKLKNALKTGGTTKAIAVCSVEAPKIASEISSEHNATIGRVSTRARNVDNRADRQQREVLKTFAKALKDESRPPEHFSTNNSGALYMKAIVVQPLCLACHGETLSADTIQALENYYPKDSARGYKVGDLRGAFVVKWDGSDR